MLLLYFAHLLFIYLTKSVTPPPSGTECIISLMQCKPNHNSLMSTIRGLKPVNNSNNNNKKKHFCNYLFIEINTGVAKRSVTLRLMSLGDMT